MDHEPRAILFYAPGGGLGHLTRSLAIIRHLRSLVDSPILLWTTSPFAHLAVAEGVPVLRWPGRSEWLGWQAEDTFPAAVLKLLKPGCVVVDTFAGGPRGELAGWLEGFCGTKVLIRRPATRTQSIQGFNLVLDPVPMPVEGLDPGPAQPIGYILLRDPEEARPRETARQVLRVGPDDPRSVILALHAGPPEESLSLFHQVQLATELLRDRVVLRLATPVPLTAAPDLSPGRVPLFPASLVFSGVDLLIGGAGYNLVAEALACGKRTLWKPFPRPADDQWKRVAGALTFSETTPPAELAGLIGEGLSSPPPSALPPQERTGAQKAARLIADALQAAAVR